MKYSVLLGEDIINEMASCIRIDDLDSVELKQITNIAIKHNLEILIRVTEEGG